MLVKSMERKVFLLKCSKLYVYKNYFLIHICLDFGMFCFHTYFVNSSKPFAQNNDARCISKLTYD